MRVMVHKTWGFWLFYAFISVCAGAEQFSKLMPSISPEVADGACHVHSASPCFLYEK